MIRRTMVALCATAASAGLVPDEAFARGGGHRTAAVRTGTFAANAWRTGFYPGYRPWRPIPVAPVAAVAVGAGLAYGAYPNGTFGGGYAYYPPYDVDGNFVYNAGGYYGDGSCYLIQRRIPTPYGWVLRPIQVCN